MWGKPCSACEKRCVPNADQMELSELLAAPVGGAHIHGSCTSRAGSTFQRLRSSLSGIRVRSPMMVLMMLAHGTGRQ